MNMRGESDARAKLIELAKLFLRLGATAFGGPAAHIALMDREVVRRRGWLPPEEFLDLLAAVNFIPGPNSTEMAIHIGYRRAGIAGLVVAGVCFILPAFLIVTALAWCYVRFGALPAAGAVLYGVKPVIMAIVLQALWRLGRTAVKGLALAALGVAAIALNVCGLHEIAVLALAALVGGVGLRGAPARPATTHSPAAISAAVLSAGVPAAGALAVSAAASLKGLFFIFLKIGSVLFGSGYVLLAFLRADLVERLGWLSQAQLLDAVAVGQVTPGPVFTTATFIGYVLCGPAGALAATAGIFLPAFIFVALSAPLVPRLRRSPAAAGALDGLNVAALALMAVVSAQLGRSAVIDPTTAAIAAASAGLLLRREINSTWLIGAGALIGLSRMLV